VIKDLGTYDNENGLVLNETGKAIYSNWDAEKGHDTEMDFMFHRDVKQWCIAIAVTAHGMEMEFYVDVEGKYPNEVATIESLI
jgi:hypothetical protein